MDIVEKKHALITVGWREWLALPDLGVPAIKAKIDTGAKTSCLHAINIEPFEQDGQPWVRFDTQPIQRSEFKVPCQAPVKDYRSVTDSGGHKEDRYVIESLVSVGTHSWAIELTLTSRYNMLFKMLLGRRAMEGRVIVEPSLSYQTGKRNTAVYAA